MFEKALEFVFRAEQGAGQCLHGGLADVFLAQLGQDVGDVVGEDLIGRDNEDVFGGDGFFETVKEEGDTVQGDGGLARAGRTLDNECLGVFVPDDGCFVR